MRFIKNSAIATCMAALAGATALAKKRRRLHTSRSSINGAAKRGTVPDFSLLERSGNKFLWPIYAAKFGLPISFIRIALTLARCRRPTWPNCKIVG